MRTFESVYLSLWLWVPLAPLATLVVGIGATFRMSRYRWIAHVLVFAVMLLALPIYLWGRGIVDPTSIEHPGPGDGFGVLLYILFAVLSMISYAVYAVLCRSKLSGRRSV